MTAHGEEDARERGAALARADWPGLAHLDELLRQAEAAYTAAHANDAEVDHHLYVIRFLEAWLMETGKLLAQGRE